MDKAVAIVEKVDRLLKSSEDKTIDRVSKALEKAYKQMERELLRAYQKHAGNTSLFIADRKLLILNEIATLRQLINPQNAPQIKKDFEDLLTGADEQGRSMAAALIEAISNEKLSSFAGVNLDAIRFQAQDAYNRLYRWSETMRDNISSIVEMHLAIGSGSQKVARALRTELGILKGRAENIARSETIQALDSATREAYKRSDVGYVQRVATQDSRVCSRCAARAGKVYRIDEAPAAIHSQDRCYNLPYKKEWAELGLINEDWINKHAAAVKKQVEDRREKLDNSASQFEKAAGIEPPTPIWEPIAEQTP